MSTVTNAGADGAAFVWCVNARVISAFKAFHCDAKILSPGLTAGAVVVCKYPAAAVPVPEGVPITVSILLRNVVYSDSPIVVPAVTAIINPFLKVRSYLYL